MSELLKQSENITILKQIETEFQQAKRAGLVLALFIDRAGILNVRFSEDVKQFSVDKLCAHLCKQYVNILYNYYFDYTHNCQALLIEERRQNPLPGIPL